MAHRTPVAQDASYGPFECELTSAEGAAPRAEEQDDDDVL